MQYLVSVRVLVTQNKPNYYKQTNVRKKRMILKEGISSDSHFLLKMYSKN